jgi:hypothetical protein
VDVVDSDEPSVDGEAEVVGPGETFGQRALFSEEERPLRTASAFASHKCEKVVAISMDQPMLQVRVLDSSHPAVSSLTQSTLPSTPSSPSLRPVLVRSYTPIVHRRLS